MTTRRSYRTAAAAITLIALLCAYPAVSAGLDATVYVTLEAVDARQSADPGAPIATRIEAGKKVFGLSQKNGMVEIPLYGQRYWLPLAALALPEELDAENGSKDEAHTMALVLSATDLRAGPGTKYDVVTRLPGGVKATLLAQGVNWHKIEYDGHQGYARASALKLYGGTLYPHSDTPITYKPLTGNSKYLILINKDTQIGCVLTKDEDGYFTRVERSFPVSTGKSGNTPNGVFETLATYRWQLMKGGVYTQYAVRFNGAFLLHSVPYSRKDAATLLTKEYNKLGAAASAGCVRMRVADSKWIYDNCPIGTPVQVIKEGSYPTIPIVVPFEPIDTDIRWDPTDPDTRNPYLD